MSEPTTTIEREKTFTAKGNSYTIKFPTIGQYLDIESRRMDLSNGTYNMLMRSTLLTSEIAMELIDMISVLSSLCPKLIKDIKANSVLEMDLADGMELLKVYKEQVSPWINGWLSILKNPPKVETPPAE